MSREVYLFYDGRHPAGVVRNWPEFTSWAREHNPGPALLALIDTERPTPTADLERDLVACFSQADDWPDEAEQFLEAVLGRLFENPKLGFQYTGRRKDELPHFDINCRLLMRLCQPECVDWVNSDWDRYRPRAAALLKIGEQLAIERASLSQSPDGSQEPSKRDKRDTELVVVVELLADYPC